MSVEKRLSADVEKNDVRPGLYSPKIMDGKIGIENKSPQVTEINIEGVIGMPEKLQSGESGNKVATYEQFRAQVEKIRRIGSPEIVVNIRSGGGNVNDALLIHDALKALDKQVTTRCYGYVASAATIIAQAASQGRRELSANALYLIHRSESAAEGNADGMVQTVELLRKTDERIAAIYAARSGKPSENFAELMGCNEGKGKWLSPREALQAGLADRIIGEEPVTNEALELIEQFNLPELPEEINQNQRRNMKIKQHWKTILDFLGVTAEEQVRVAEKHLQEMDDALARTESAAENDVKAEGAEESVQNQSAADRENLRAEALETRTKPKEDPSPMDGYVSANARSYEEDARSFGHLK